MRLAGTLQSNTQAEHFGDFLYGEGIKNQVERNSDGLWDIWILDEDRLDNAKSLLVQFSESPDDLIFVRGGRVGKNKKKGQKKLRPSRNRIVDGRTVFYKLPVPYGILSLSLIAISIGVAVSTQLGENDSIVQKLFITEYTVEGDYIVYSNEFPEIRQGQVWRLFSSMFLHFGFMHILFNMLWLRDLGSLFEARKSSWLFLIFVLVIATVTNFAQFFVSGPASGGMSGVVYGLLGYVWMQGKFNPASKMCLQKQTVIMMIAWFFLCLTGIMGPIANTAHAVGAGVGIAWGYLSARLSRSV